MRNVLLVLVIAAFTLNVESATVVYSQASEVVGHSKVTEKNGLFYKIGHGHDGPSCWIAA